MNNTIRIFHGRFSDKVPVHKNSTDCDRIATVAWQYDPTINTLSYGATIYTHEKDGATIYTHEKNVSWIKQIHAKTAIARLNNTPVKVVIDENDFESRSMDWYIIRKLIFTNGCYDKHPNLHYDLRSKSENNSGHSVNNINSYDPYKTGELLPVGYHLVNGKTLYYDGEEYRNCDNDYSKLNECDRCEEGYRCAAVGLIFFTLMLATPIIFNIF